MDMRLLLTFLDAKEHICTQERAHAQSRKKASQKRNAGTKQPSTGSTNRVPKRVLFEKHCKLFKKLGGMHTTHTTKDCHKNEKDGMMKADLCTAKKAGKKPNPAKQSFTQLSKKLDKLEKSLKKASLKSKKCRRVNSNSNRK